MKGICTIVLPFGLALLLFVAVVKARPEKWPSRPLARGAQALPEAHSVPSLPPPVKSRPASEPLALDRAALLVRMAGELRRGDAISAPPGDLTEVEIDFLAAELSRP